VGSRFRNRGNTQPTPPVCKSKIRIKHPHGPPSGCKSGLWPTALNISFQLFPIGGGPTNYTFSGQAGRTGNGAIWDAAQTAPDGMTWHWHAEISCFDDTYFIQFRASGGALPGPMFFLPVPNWVYDFGADVVMPARPVPFLSGATGWALDSGGQQ
jgi:hypothetical protein